MYWNARKIVNGAVVKIHDERRKALNEQAEFRIRMEAIRELKTPINVAIKIIHRKGIK